MKNALTEAYQKTGLRSHSEVVLYYWGLLEIPDSSLPGIFSAVNDRLRARQILDQGIWKARTV